MNPAGIKTVWPTTDRQWARGHVGCNVSTCSNGKCRATGECVDKVVTRQHVTIAERHAAAGPRWVDDAPPVAPMLQVYSPRPVAPAGSNTGHGHVWERPDGMKARCGGPGMCSVCSYDAARHAIKAQRPPPVQPVAVSEQCTRTDIHHPDHCVFETPRTIIAFTGLAGSGKSTAAAHLVKHHGFQRVRFAGPLKAMLAALGCTPAEIDGSKKETPCALLGGKTPRHAMQTLGTEWGRELIASDLWIRAWEHALSQVPAGVPVVVDDCRFPNEADAVRAAGGVVVGIERPGAGAGAAGHKSEGNALQAVATLLNAADVAHLLAHVDRLVADLSWRESHAAA